MLIKNAITKYAGEIKWSSPKITLAAKMPSLFCSTPRNSNSSANPAKREITHISGSVKWENRGFRWCSIVCLNEFAKGIFPDFSERRRTKREKGIAAPIVPMRLSRNIFPVRGNNWILKYFARTSANSNAKPSVIKTKNNNFDLFTWKSFSATEGTAQQSRNQKEFNHKGHKEYRTQRTHCRDARPCVSTYKKKKSSAGSGL